MRKIDLLKSPEVHCPRWDFCSVNKCPLSKKYSKLQNDSSDPSKIQKEKCVCKKIRKEIGGAFGLKFGGLTAREFNGLQNWQNLSEEEQKARTSKLQENSPISKLSAKGYAIIPKKRVTSQTHEQNGQIALFQAEKGDVVRTMRDGDELVCLKCDRFVLSLDNDGFCPLCACEEVLR